MKRFQFTLRPVAILRAHKELRAREALAAAMRATAAATEALHAARARTRALEETISQGRSETFRPAEQMSFYQDYRRAAAGESGAARRLAEARAGEERRRLECVRANRELKIIARLEEKARAVHRAAGLLEEQKLIDEIAGFRAIRRAAATSPS